MKVGEHKKQILTMNLLERKYYTDSNIRKNIEDIVDGMTKN